MLTLLILTLVISFVLGIIGFAFRASLAIIKCIYPFVIAAAACYAIFVLSMSLIRVIPAALAVCLVFYLVMKLF